MVFIGGTRKMPSFGGIPGFHIHKADEINRFGPDDLLARAYELAFDEKSPPPPDELCMNLGE